MPAEVSFSPSPLPSNGTVLPPNDEISSLIEVSSFAIAAVVSILLVGALVTYALRFFRISYSAVPDSWVFLSIGCLVAIILDFGSFGPAGSNLARVVGAIDESFPEIFFAALLPPIVFQSGFELNVVELVRSFGAILTFAFLGTLISTVVIGLLLWGISQIPIFVAFSAIQAFILGTVLSATDTVAVIAAFDKLKVPDDLYALVHGESVFNDAVAIVIFRELCSFELSGTVTAGEIFKGVGLFIANFLGSTVIGIGVGALNSLLFKYVRLRDQSHQSTGGLELEKVLLFLTPYVGYFIAEGVKVSGVVAILFTGVVTGMYTIKNVSSSSKRFVGHLYRMLAHVCEALCFVYIGIAIPMLGSADMSNNGGWQLAFLLIILCLGARAISTYVCTRIVNYSRPPARKVSNEARFVVWMAGLRGGVAFALATAASKVIGNKQVSAVLPPVTLCIVVVSMVTIPTTIGKVIKKMGLGGEDDGATSTATTGAGDVATGSDAGSRSFTTSASGTHSDDDDDDALGGVARSLRVASGGAGTGRGGHSPTAASPGRADPDRFKRAREMLLTNVTPPPAMPPSSSLEMQSMRGHQEASSDPAEDRLPTLASFSSAPNITARMGLLASATSSAGSESVDIRPLKPLPPYPNNQHRRRGGTNEPGHSLSASSLSSSIQSSRRSSLGSGLEDDGSSAPAVGGVDAVVADRRGLPGDAESSSASSSDAVEIRRSASAAGRDKLVSLLLGGAGSSSNSNNGGDGKSSSDRGTASPPTASLASSGAAAQPAVPGTAAEAAPPTASATGTTAAAAAFGKLMSFPSFSRRPSATTTAGPNPTSDATSSSIANAAPVPTAASASASTTSSSSSSFGLMFKQAGEKIAAVANQALLARTQSGSNAGSAGKSDGSSGSSSSSVPSFFTTYAASRASASNAAGDNSSSSGSSNAGRAGVGTAAAVDRLLAGGTPSGGDDDDVEGEFSITFGLPPARDVVGGTLPPKK